MRKLTLIILITIIIISGRNLIKTFNEYHIAEEYYKAIQIECVEINEDNRTPLAASSLYVTEDLPTKAPLIKENIFVKKEKVPVEEIRAYTTTECPPITIDFSSLRKINSDIIGWIYSEDTPINYPILHSSSNNKYIHTLFNGKYSANGSIFLDSACISDFSNDNSILYGHHMRNGSMFASLNNYKEQDYYDKHNKIWLLTPKQNYLLLPFSAMVATTDNICYNTTIPDKRAFIDYTIINSFFAPEVAPTIADRFLTLSTCDYTFDNARLVVLCILVPII